MKYMASNKALQGIDTLIARGCRIEGRLVFQGGLRVDGRVAGDVCADPPEQGYLVLSHPAHICGDVRAGHVVIDGLVEGNLHISGRVELLCRARIIGDIHYGSLEMRPGAAVTGQLCPTSEVAVHAGGALAPLLKLA